MRKVHVHISGLLAGKELSKMLFNCCQNALSIGDNRAILACEGTNRIFGSSKRSKLMKVARVLVTEFKPSNGGALLPIRLLFIEKPIKVPLKLAALKNLRIGRLGVVLNGLKLRLDVFDLTRKGREEIISELGEGEELLAVIFGVTGSGSAADVKPEGSSKKPS
uniref:Uncharacterized protein n=1 Tax=Cannabis sativa TaxID=3483 RepID=A0A803QQV5_CANSA